MKPHMCGVKRKLGAQTGPMMLMGWAAQVVCISDSCRGLESPGNQALFHSKARQLPSCLHWTTTARPDFKSLRLSPPIYRLRRRRERNDGFDPRTLNPINLKA